MGDDPKQPISVDHSFPNPGPIVGTASTYGSTLAVDAQPETSKDSAPDSTSLADHCRVAHFTLFSLCVAMLIALSADPDRRLTETINELDQAKLLLAHWQDLTAKVSGVVSQDQRQGTKFEIFGTVTLDGSPMDVTVDLDIRDLWVPFHSHLYNRVEPTSHVNKLVQPGVSADSLAVAWDWATDLQWIFVPTKPLTLMNIGRVELEAREWAVEQTIRTDVRPTATFSQDQHRGTSKLLVMADMSFWNTAFGPLPHEYSSEPNKGHVTFYGSGGGPPSLLSQVVTEMHIDTRVVGPRSFSRDKDRTVFEPHRVRSMTLRIPVSGSAENVAPLSTLGKSLGIPIVAAEKFNARFPRIAALSPVYRSLSIQQCRQVLDEQRSQLSQKSLSVAGLEIPLAFVVRWGQLIVIVVFAYFLVNVYELSRRLGENPIDKGWTAAWITVYPSTPARGLTIASGFLLPTGIGLLTVQRVLTATGGQDKVLALISAAALIALSVVALILFKRLAKPPLK